MQYSYDCDKLYYYALNKVHNYYYAFYLSAVPEYKENTISKSVDVISEGTCVLLDTRIVYRNGGDCGIIQETNGMELREGDCSTGNVLYGCVAGINQSCGANSAYPNVEVEMDPSVDGHNPSPSEYYRFRLRVRNVPVDVNTTYCAVLHIESPKGVVRIAAKRFNVMYRGQYTCVNNSMYMCMRISTAIL